MNEPRMLYYGPWDRAGHFFFDENGWRTASYPHHELPWKEGIDGWMQPNSERTGPEIEGEALLHHKDGWTALCFWDRSVDTRGGSNSNYFAKGTFTFDQMVEMAKTRFAERWNRMKFEVRLATVTR